MTTKRPLTLYNPHLLRKDELLAGFIARQPLLDALVDDLRRGGGQHHLLVGVRGAGKTTLLLRLAAAVDDDPALAERAVALRFPEEQYNLIRLSDFWLNCLDALVDALERRGEAAEAQRLDAVIATVDALPDEDERAAQALGHLTTWATQRRQLVVLLLDNLDLIFDRLNDAQWALRKALSDDHGLVVIGASSSAVPETFEYGQAFYDFFNLHELTGLDDDEARRVLVRLSEVMDTPQVLRAIEDHPGRLRALLLLSGGTPRTLQLLHGVLAQGGTDRAERDLEQMLDQVTPYYKARFEDLPAQGQQIFDAVALHWHPMTAIECAERTRLDVTLVSAQLTRLSRQGVIAKVPHASGKLAFQIAERFFGIWYLMRASRRLRRKLLWLAVSVEELYGTAELERRGEALLASTEGALAAEDPAKLLSFAAVATDATLKRRLERRAVAMMTQAGEAGLGWRGLELDGEDRDRKDQALDAAEPLDVPAALSTALGLGGKDWSATRERVAQCLTRPDREDWRWQAPHVWFWAAHFGHAREAAALLHDLGLHERALPLYEALRAYAAGTTDLLHLAPEVRAPTEIYLAAFSAYGTPPATSPSPAPPSPSRPRSGRAAKAPPGTPGSRRRTRPRP